MNELKTFKNEDFGEVRTIIINGELYLVGKDVANILGYANSRKALNDHVDDEDKGVTNRYTLGGKQEITIINESGLYSLILKSKMPNAKKFKRWVTSEVLPSIRKHGAYLTSNKIEDLLLNPDTIIRLATDLKAERENNIMLHNKIEEQAPCVLFAKTVESSQSTILIGELAKILKQSGYDTGQKRLFNTLREDGYLIKGGSSKNMPTQKSAELGIIEIKESTTTNADGSIRINKTPKITGKGQTYFINLFLENRVRKELH